MKFSGAINVTNTSEDLIEAETTDFRQNVHSRLVPDTAYNVSHVVSTQSDIASMSPKSHQNVSLSQVFKKHNYLKHLIKRHNTMVNDKPRVKRNPWFEYHNNIYYISRNYTHEQLIKAQWAQKAKFWTFTLTSYNFGKMKDISMKLSGCVLKSHSR